jgi:hypothetical protein
MGPGWPAGPSPASLGRDDSCGEKRLQENLMNISIPRLLYEDSFGVFLLVTVFLGGGAAWLTGRAIAGTWRPWWQLPAYVLLLAAAVRFIHSALFGGTLVSPRYYLVDAIVCLIFAMAAFRTTRAGQMSTQYAFIHARRGLFGWRRRSVDAASEPRDSG